MDNAVLFVYKFAVYIVMDVFLSDVFAIEYSLLLQFFFFFF